MYEKELDVENKRLLRMQSEEKDEHELRHQACSSMCPFPACADHELIKLGKSD